MAPRIPVLIRIAGPSAAFCTANILFFPQYFSKTPVSTLFIAVSAVYFLIWFAFHSVVYPNFLSPLRHLPQPKRVIPFYSHFRTQFQRPAGQAYLDLANSIPNDGIIRLPSLFNIDQLLLTDPKTLAEVLVHKNYEFEKPKEIRGFLRLILGDGMIVVEGDVHKFQRKHVSPAFSFRHIKELIPIFWNKAVQLRDGVLAEMRENPEADKRSVVEINHWANKVTMDIIGVAGLGRDFNALKNTDDPLVRVYEEILEPTAEKLAFFVSNLVFGRPLVSKLPWRLNQRLKDNTDQLTNICLRLVSDKRQLMKQDEKGQFDILSLLIKSDSFDDRMLVDQLLTFLAAGHETTSSAFTWATYLLSKHQDIQTRLREEIRTNLASPSSLDSSTDMATVLESLPLLHAVCNETLRLYPTVPSTIRVAVKDTTINNVHIPRTTRIQLVPWAINRSPKLWGPNADQFYPERWIEKDGHHNNTGGVTSNYANLTFLHGPRSCIGEKFAKSELKALVAVFCGSFHMEMADLNEVAEPAGVITTKPKDGMRLRLKALDGW